MIDQILEYENKAGCVNERNVMEVFLFWQI